MPRERTASNLDPLFAHCDHAIRHWTERAADYGDLRVGDHHNASDAIQILLAALNRIRRERDAAISLIHLLTGERMKVRQHLSVRSRPAGQDALYRSLGLDPQCPAFLLKAARTAYRRRWHPDTCPDHDTKKAHRRF